jgi:hypothetical protein
MSAFPGIDPIVVRLSQITNDNDVGSMLLIAALVAAMGAGFGLVLVWARAHLARRAASSAALARVPSDPDATLRFRWVRARSVPSMWRDVEAPRRNAGDAWLRGYMARLRVALPGLKDDDVEVPVPCVEVAPGVLGAVDQGPKGATSPDATLKIDARILSRIVRDVDIVQSDPITLILGSGEGLSPDATVKTPALSVEAMETGDWHDVGNFQYGARRS